MEIDNFCTQEMPLIYYTITCNISHLNGGIEPIYLTGLVHHSKHLAISFGLMEAKKKNDHRYQCLLLRSLLYLVEGP